MNNPVWRGLLVFLALCGCGAAEASPRTRALRWADRLYRKAVADGWHPSGFRNPYTRLELIDAAVAYERVRDRFGPGLAVELGRARSLERLSGFSEASAAYHRALRLSPRLREAEDGLRRCRLLAAQARKIRAGDGERILFDALEVHPASTWLIVSSTGAGGAGAQAEKARLHLVRPGAGPPRLLWASGPDGAEDGPDPFFGREVGAVVGQELYLRRLSPRGAPLVFALVGQSPMAGTTDTRMIVFRLAGGRLERIWAIGGTVSVVLRDLDRDGRLEIGVEDEVGFDLAHAGQPRWMDWYGWDGRSYRAANRRFRGTFREVERQLREVRVDVPADPDVLAHLGQIHEMSGRRRAAAAAYRLAIAECRRRLQRGDNAEVRELLRDTEARLRNRSRP